MRFVYNFVAPMQIEHFPELPSTNTRALELAREGAQGRWIILADAQTRGRGQRGADWHSPAGAGLYVSFLYRPNITPSQMSVMTLLAGIAVHDAINHFMPEAVSLKWPNDILVKSGAHRGAKVGGILVESSTDTQRVNYLVVGIGVNLQGAPDMFTPRARSLAQLELGSPPLRDSLLEHLRSILDQKILELEEGMDRTLIYKAWEFRALGLGESVELWEDGELTQAAALEGLAPNGQLRVRLLSGQTKTFLHGKIRLDAERPWLSFPP